jgi:GH24 family phage-related lysozyme (muramidase)/uncharacterized Zn-binding protein involved in type VI secretion
MPHAARTSDPISPHSPCGPEKCGAGSKNVIIQGLPAYRVGDSTVPHGVPHYVPAFTCVPHVTPLVSGSHNVFVNGQPAGRVGDSHSCGVKVLAGANKVHINDAGTGGGYSSVSARVTESKSQASATQTKTISGGVPSSLSSFIQQKEGFVSCAFLDGSQYTNGFGTEANSPTECISESEAKTRMDSDRATRRTFVTNYSTNNGYNWSSTQIDALTSFAYNLGTGAIAQVTANSTRTDAVIVDKILLYNKASGVVSSGLTQRRQEESDWFKSGM